MESIHTLIRTLLTVAIVSSNQSFHCTACFMHVLIVFFFLSQNNPQLSNMEFGRRLAVERELEKTPYFSLPNACERIPECLVCTFCV